MGCGGSKDPTQPDPGSVQMRGTDAGAKDTDAPGTDVVGKEASAESRMTAPDVHEGEAEGEANATVAEPEGEAEGEKVDEQRYTGAESIWAALKEKHVRLIKSSWIVEHNKTGNPLPRRQELPEEAFISVEELKRQYGDGNRDGVLPIIGISFCWDTAPNPDPRAKQLKTVAAMLEQERPKYAAVGFTEMGVFWDWLSMHQKDPTKFDESETPMSKPVAERAAFEQELKNGTKFFGGEEYEKSRTEEEKESFRFALHETMDLWYAHQGTTVYMLTKLPEGTTRTNGYDESGWTTYERCSAEQIKKVFLWEAKWKLVLDLGASDESDEAAKARKWPHSPDDFDQLIGAKKFTNGADQETVKKLFRKMSTNQLGYIQLLDFTGIAKPTVEDAKRLGRCLNLCKRLDKLDLTGVGMDGETCKAMLSTLTTAQFKELKLYGNNIGPEGGAALAEGLKGNSTLQSLDLSGNSLGDEGVTKLAAVLKETKIEKLKLDSNRLEPKGGAALAEGIKGNSTLQSLSLKRNGLGPEGGAALAQGLKGNSTLQSLELTRNDIGDEGASALAEGLKGNSTLQSLELQYNNLNNDAKKVLRDAAGSDIKIEF